MRLRAEETFRPPNDSPVFRTRTRATLLGGALGDALGAPIEFMGLDQIRARYGPVGIAKLHSAYGRVGAITDDTQMTLFTAEGLLRAISRARHSGGTADTKGAVFGAYSRWLQTQGFGAACNGPLGELDGWLVTIPALHDRRAPGNTCIAAIRAGTPGTIERPVNESKGCGGVMRAAPAGVVGADPFNLGCETAAVTHGHPSGYLAAGALALMISCLLENEGLEAAGIAAIDRLHRAPHGGECARALEHAMDAWRSLPASAETVERLGQGWVAEEALAIALYASLACRGDFLAGLRLAVNHSGDSDSTGAIAGNLLGALLGIDAIPASWLEQLELRAEIEALADDLVTQYRDDPQWRERYPPA